MQSPLDFVLIKPFINNNSNNYKKLMFKKKYKGLIFEKKHISKSKLNILQKRYENIYFPTDLR